MNDRERRTLSGSIELRAEAGKPTMFVGYAARFDSLSNPLGGGSFRETIRPGAFARALREGQECRALVDHDPSRILGRRGAGTLRMVEDERGLRVEIDIPDTSYARDTMESVRRRDVEGMSFAFRAQSESWDWATEPATRTLEDVDLFDVSVVTDPAYPDTSVAVRSMEQHRPKARTYNTLASLLRLLSKS